LFRAKKITLIQISDYKLKNYFFNYFDLVYDLDIERLNAYRRLNQLNFLYGSSFLYFSSAEKKRKAQLCEKFS